MSGLCLFTLCFLSQSFDRFLYFTFFSFYLSFPLILSFSSLHLFWHLPNTTNPWLSTPHNIIFFKCVSLYSAIQNSRSFSQTCFSHWHLRREDWRERPRDQASWGHRTLSSLSFHDLRLLQKLQEHVNVFENIFLTDWLPQDWPTKTLASPPLLRKSGGQDTRSRAPVEVVTCAYKCIQMCNVYKGMGRVHVCMLVVTFVYIELLVVSSGTACILLVCFKYFTWMAYESLMCLVIQVKCKRQRNMQIYIQK